jgi:hypothetical protein
MEFFLLLSCDYDLLIVVFSIWRLELLLLLLVE